MTEQPTPAVRETLIDSVPILIGHIDAKGLVMEIEGSLPKPQALGEIIPGRTLLADLLPDGAEDIDSALAGNEARFNVRVPDGDALAHFEICLAYDRKRGGGAYFLIHDVTETYRLQVALIECTDREQIRIGQELHDSLGQDLTAISYQLHAARQKMPKALSETMESLQDQISACLKNARDVAFKLSPNIGGEDIFPAFERLSAHVANAFDLECHFTPQLERAITDPGVAFHLFRIAQEACTNAVRHAAPGRIEIRLTTGSENQLEITDDGRGINPAKASVHPGMGIAIMKFRAQALGGSLRISSRKPNGTLVRCRFENKRTPEVDVPVEKTTCPTCS